MAAPAATIITPSGSTRRIPDTSPLAPIRAPAVSRQRRRTWSSWYNQPTGQFYHLAADNRFPYWVYSGQQDSGTVSIASRSDYGAPNMRDWRPVGGDERDYDIPDPVDPNIVFGSGLGGHVSRWDARTGQVTDVSPWPVQNYGLRPTTVAHHFNWVNPLVASRAGPPSLYLGGDVIFKTADRGATWTVISPDLTGKRPDAQRCVDDVAIADAVACGYGTITAIEPSPRSPAELWTGSDSGILGITRDGGASWTQTSLPGLPAWSKISSIDISSIDPDARLCRGRRPAHRRLAPACLPHARWRANLARRSRAGLPAGQMVSAVRSDPVRPGLLYAGTETSVFVSFDDGDNWQPLRQNLPTAWARDLLVHGDDLIVATQGRAIWVLGDLALLRQLRPDCRVERRAAVRARARLPRQVRQQPRHPARARDAGRREPAPRRNDRLLAARRGERPGNPRNPRSRGAVVRRFSSADRPAQVPAERYFADDWVKPDPRSPHPPAPIAGSGTCGVHVPRPWPTITRSPPSGVSTRPLDPRGQFVEPGRYTAVLSVDGRSQTASFDVLPDPRVTNADYRAARAFSESLYEPMEKAWRGYAETKAVRDALAKRMAAIRDSGAARAGQALARSSSRPRRPMPASKAKAAPWRPSKPRPKPVTLRPPKDCARSPAGARRGQRRLGGVAAGQGIELEALNRRLAAAGLRRSSFRPKMSSASRHGRRGATSPERTGDAPCARLYGGAQVAADSAGSYAAREPPARTPSR